MKHRFSTFFLLAVSLHAMSFPPSILALGGPANGPCGPPSDTPTHGNIAGGSEDLQQYSDPSGRKILKVCFAYRKADGTLEHDYGSSDYIDNCYSLKGIGTSSISVQRINTSYEVPSWQTGPEAGKCQPLVHLDVFLSAGSTATPGSTSTPTPTSSTSSNAGSSSSTGTASPTPSPSARTLTPSVKNNSGSADSDSEDVENVENEGQLLGEMSENGDIDGSGSAELMGVKNNISINQSSKFSIAFTKFLEYWWMILIGFFLIFFGIFYWRGRKNTEVN